MATGFIDPVAQTFFVDAGVYKKGIFVHSVDLVFYKKDLVTYQTFKIQLRPTLNGYPHSSMIHSGATLGQVTLKPEQINVVDVETTVPSLSNSNHYTRFVFPAPIFLLPGEHAIVMFTNSDNYSIYVSEIGDTRLGDTTGRRVDKQPYSGSFFKSQNGSTYTPYQNMDLMFRVNFCRFTNGTTTLTSDNFIPVANLEYDILNLTTQDLTFKDTNIDYFYKGTSNSTLLLDSEFENLVVNKNNTLKERKIVLNTSNTIVLKADLRTTDNTVSPVIDTTRLGIIATKYHINDCQLSDDNFTIINSGTGYTANAIVTVTGSTTGAGATVRAVANTTTQTIERIEVLTPGSGYTEDITAVCAAPTVPSNNTTCQIYVSSETDSKGGPALARYITRSVTLSDGFDANMLRVYLTAYQPQQATVEVYYKVLSDEDPTLFKDRPYVRMLNVQQGDESLLNTLKSQIENQYIEYLFKPSTEDISYIGTNDVLYNTFKTFAIKIIMRTTNPAYTPIVRDLRVIALAP